MTLYEAELFAYGEGAGGRSLSALYERYHVETPVCYNVSHSIIAAYERGRKFWERVGLSDLQRDMERQHWDAYIADGGLWSYEVVDLVRQRLEARNSKDWALADAIRGRLNDAGIELRDSADKTEWSRLRFRKRQYGRSPLLRIE